MSITHTHPIVVEDFNGDEMISNHVDETGREFGHEAHKTHARSQRNASERTDEHTHDDVDAVYNPLTSDWRHRPVEKEEKEEKAEARPTPVARPQEPPQS